MRLNSGMQSLRNFKSKTVHVLTSFLVFNSLQNNCVFLVWAFVASVTM